MTSNEEYRRVIKQMIDRIDNNHDLKQIYTITHVKLEYERSKCGKNQDIL